ncbi:MAG: DUF2452 domain-containing protein [Sandaracinus sp.]|nr:DUF2452 domain-containing protein [Myxococcales bacterium]MCB9599240.1 DUF2452 domain-containing protein [Sandaracinus sp.]MCB9614812.1 DUF2452 domain-containing protein [Sandaracinus sp.]MCB9621140.1 DUF2452 domain-containing protein [Sandaracinus sp.]MCB9631513.1 DUF2452 domain-containing protein [Sandaracinus sp.]
MSEFDDGGKHRGPAHSSPYGLSRLAPSITLVDVAKEIERADEMIGAVTASKLEVIAEQIRQLQERARAILDDAKRDLELHRATCAFPRLVGKTYHLYEKATGALYWSMVSPDEWGGAPPHAFRGSFRLEGDQSWTRVDEDEGEGERVDAHAVLRQLRG